MKNYFKYMAGIASLLVVFACDPYEDYYDELDAEKAGKVPFDTKEFDYTLADADYELLATVDGGADIAKNKDFSSPEEAGRFIPQILSTRFPLLGDGSQALVTYKLYAPVRIRTKEKDTLDTQDYIDINESNSRLNSQADITKAAAYVWPDADQFDMLTLWYNYFANGATTVDSSKVVSYNKAWVLPYVVTAADYTFMGQSFANFDNRTTAITRIAVMFNQKYPFAAVGDARMALYQYTYVPEGGTRVTEDAIALTIYDGTKWVGQTDVIPVTLQFGHDGTTWAPDNTKTYTLAVADYKAIAANKGLDNSDAQNANQYGNFDRRRGAANEWTDAEVEAGLDFLLNSLFPDAAEGQKYAVTFAVYTGTAGTETFVMIKDDGKYVRFVK
jgi:hypothetical protein